MSDRNRDGRLDLCRREKPDLAILDIMLPDVRWPGDLQSHPRSPELSQVPVIFLTARASEADRIIGLELGANDYIVKPFFVRELMARVKTQFRGPSIAPRVMRSGRWNWTATVAWCG